MENEKLYGWIGPIVLIVIIAAIAVWWAGLKLWIAIPAAVVAVFINALLVGFDED